MIEIKPIQLHQSEEVKHLILAVCDEVFQVSEETIKRFDTMSDIDEVRSALTLEDSLMLACGNAKGERKRSSASLSHYFDNGGTFLVLLDRGRVVGSGAIRRLDEEICELKRMWLIKEYRGRGLAKNLVHILLDFARNARSKKVRLDLFDAQRQAQAVEFYKRMGFYAIAPYNESFCTVFMEKII